MDESPGALALSYEKEACNEVIRWLKGKENLDLLSRALRFGARPLLNFLEKRLPAQVVDGFEVLLAESLNKCFHLGKMTTSVHLICHRLRQSGIIHNDLNQIRLLDLKHQDKVARSFYSEHALIAALEGASCGLGGITFALADIPMLLSINFRLIQQIALSYGESLDGEENRILVLKILLMGLGDEPLETRLENWNKLNNLPGSWVQHQSEKSLAALGKDRFFLGTMQKLIAALGLTLTRRKIFTLMPIAGGVINAGINYFMTKKTAESAYHIFRYKTLQSRGYDLSEAKLKGFQP